jgi:hypothetical protein
MGTPAGPQVPARRVSCRVTSEIRPVTTLRTEFKLAWKAGGGAEGVVFHHIVDRYLKT